MDVRLDAPDQLTFPPLEIASFTLDANGVVVTWSDSAERLERRRHDDVVGRPYACLLPSAKADQVAAEVLDAARTHGWHVHRHAAPAPNGAVIEVTRTVIAQRDRGGELAGFGVITLPRSGAGEPLPGTLEQLAASAPGVLCAFCLRPDGSMSMPYASPAIEALYGFPPEAVALDASPVFAITVPDDAERLKSSIAHSARTMSLWHHEFRIRHPHRGEVWVEGRSTPRREPDGSVVWYGFVSDVTARKDAERRASTQAAVSRVLAGAESLEDAATRVLETLGRLAAWQFGALLVVDTQREWLKVSRVWKAPGFDGRELTAKAHTLRFSKGMGLSGRVWESGSAIYLPDITADGQVLRLAQAEAAGIKTALGVPIKRHGRVIGVFDLFGTAPRSVAAEWVVMYEEIGNQLGVFIERQHALEEVQRFVSLSPSVIYAGEIDQGRVVLTWTSENLLQLAGHRASEVAGVDGWTGLVHEDDRERYVAAHPFPYDVEHQVIEFRLRRRNGEYFWARDEKRLLFDDEGRPAQVVGTLSDVTDRVRLEEQLRQSQKLEAVGRLAGGVAHDFNNLLTVISGYSELLLATMPADDPDRGFIADIRQAGERATALTRHLLAFSRRQVLEPKVVDLNAVLRDLEKLLRRVIGEDIVLLTTLAPSTCLVRVDTGQMEQVIVNLAVNARDAMPSGGRLLIETHEVELDEEYVRAHPDSRVGLHVRMTVADTGVGMSRAVLARAFEPFFTTKAEGTGTGLGLSTVFGVVTQSGGHVDVASTPGVGTTFRVYLPAVPASGVVGVAETPVHTVRRGSETVLLTEDEESVRRIARTALLMQGYTVLEAAGGAEALALAESHTGPIHLLLTDVVMPRMSGRQLADELVRQRPSMRVLFMSGYIDDAMMRHGIVEGREKFLAKPFSPLTLARKIREVLG